MRKLFQEGAADGCGCIMRKLFPKSAEAIRCLRIFRDLSQNPKSAEANKCMHPQLKPEDHFLRIQLSESFLDVGRCPV